MIQLGNGGISNWIENKILDHMKFDKPKTSPKRVKDRSFSKMEKVFILITVIVLMAIGSIWSYSTAFCFAVGGIWGMFVIIALEARGHFFMNRFRYTLRQYAGLDSPLGDQARDVLREEREG